MEIIAIVAQDEERGIGKDDIIPWKCLQDLKRVKELRQGQHLVMGRKTWESIPEKFSKRMLEESFIHVLSRDLTALRSKKFNVYNSKKQFEKELLQMNPSRVFVFGGEEIYKLFWNDLTHIYVSDIEGKYNCNKFFPEIKESEFKLLNQAFFPKKNPKGVNHLFSVFEKIL